MTFPRLLGTHHHHPGNMPGLVSLIQTLIDTALEEFTPPAGGGGVEPAPSPWPVLESLTALTDGVATSFETVNVYVEGSTRVFAEGLLLEPLIDWAEDELGGFVTLAWPPAPGTQLAVAYLAAVL